MTAVDQIIDDILKAEGGYADHPADRGGPTMHGITEAVARANGYHGEMRDLPRDLARAIYLRRYVNDPGFDRVVALDPGVGAELVDTGVNMGPTKAAEFLQRALNAFNSEGRYSDLVVDGKVGPASIAALRSFIDWRGVAGRSALLCAMNCLQGARYIELTEARRTQRAFAYGWISKRVML